MDAAIIMPVFGQGPLLCESITSALDQETDYEYRIVLVDDNCPQQETVDNCHRFARCYPDRILYWRSPRNRGLAAMRNEGIRLALELWPDIFAVTSLDGDDRLHPLFVERSISALKAAQEEPTQGFRYGWVFEDPDHFGVDGVMLRTHGYSSLFSMAGCSNTPTSPMLADIFRAGIRFREQMKAGSEDWQFWLHALKKGFRGKYVPKIGFRYRRKAGSMAFFAFKRADRNRAEIRLTHPEIFHPDFYLAAEAQEAPRYALVGHDDHDPCANLGPNITVISVHDLARRLERYSRAPTTPLPQHLFMLPPRTLAELRRTGVLDWVLWRLEMLAGTESVINARIFAPGDRDQAIAITSDSSFTTETDFAEVVCISSKLLLNYARGAISWDGLRQQRHVRQTNFWLRNIPTSNVALEFERFRDHFKRIFKPYVANFSRHRTTAWKPFGVERYDMGKHFFGSAPILAALEAKHEILLVAQEEDLARPRIADIVLSLADGAAESGRKCSLLVLGSRIDKHLAGHFVRLLLLRQVQRHGKIVIEAGDKALLGLLLPFGTVISIACASIAPDLNQLRRYGRVVLGVLPERSTGATQLHEDLLHCFKVFTGVYCVNETEMARAEALGVAPEQIIASAEDLLNKAGGIEAIPE